MTNTQASERYALGDEIASGGQGLVYEAHDRVLNRDVAVKVLKSGFDKDSAPARRFQEEARITGQLQHPGIPPIHDLGTLPDGRPFLAMKLIRGRTLAQVLDEKPGFVQLAPVFEQVCQAVAYAHDRKVIHRDLKPANVMVGAFGEVQVMDWGLAKVLGEVPANVGDRTAESASTSPEETIAHGTEVHSDRDESSHTRAGSVMGTPAYMPPEQAVGATDQVDVRSDVFGLGGILCALLTGKPPYVGANSESTRQMASQVKLDDAWLRLDACGAEAEWIALCKRCLAAEKEDRPKDGAEVASAVAGLRTAAEARARQAELDRVRVEGELRNAELKASELRRRRRIQVALAGALALLLAAGGAFASWSDSRATLERFENEQRATAERERGVRTAEAVAVLLEQCESALRAEDVDRAALALEAARKRAEEGGAEALASRTADCEADLTLLRELDRIDALKWTYREGKFATYDEISTEWVRAFAPRGKERAAESPNIRDRVLKALDEWHSQMPSVPLMRVLFRVDPDPYRCRVRMAMLLDGLRDALFPSGIGKELFGGPGGRVLVLANQPEALEQPTRFAAVLGDYTQLPSPRRVEILEAALRRRPDDFGLLMVRGGTNTNPSSEEIWFRAAAARRPSHPVPRHNLANALRKKGDVPAAIAMYREVLRLDPTMGYSWSSLGSLLTAQNDHRGAAEAYATLAKLDPTNAYVHLLASQSLSMAGERARAESAAREALRVNPKYGSAHVQLGWLFETKSDFPQATAAYREAVRFEPESAEAHASLGRMLAVSKQWSAALVQFESAMLLQPATSKYRVWIGDAWHALGSLPEAIRAYRDAIRLVGPNQRTELRYLHHRLGEMYFTSRNLPEAERCIRKALEFEPDDPNANDWAAHIRLRLLDPDGALPFAERSVARAPNVAQAQVNLGYARLGTGNASGAIAAFHEAIRLDPNRTDSKHLLELTRTLERGHIAPQPREVKR